ncbi:MAG: hypothetical protein WAQ41_01450 [bacterium]|jgi:hypothetical protein|nr:pilus assembly protein PilM [Bacillota bacterium]HHW55215.1 pilus assembly protein PilM [Bacillota bacterium]
MGFGTKKYLGLYIGAEDLTAAELWVRGTRIQVAKVGIKAAGCRFNDPGELAEALAQLWQASGFSSQGVTLAIGGPSIFYRVLPLPKIPVAELRRALEWELADHFPFSAQEAVFDLRPLEVGTGLGSNEGYYLVVAAPRSLIEGYLTALQLAGLEPWAIEPEPLALLRSWEGLEKASLLLILRPSYVTIGLVAGGELFFARSLSWGLEVVREGRAAGEKLSRECQNTLGYFQARTGQDTFVPEEVVIYNGGRAGALEVLLPELKGSFTLPIRLAPPPGSKLSWIPETAEEEKQLLAVCIGSGLREVRKGGRD